MIGKNIEDSIKVRLIITAMAAGMLFELKAANVKLPKSFADIMAVKKVAGRIYGAVLVKIYSVFKKRING